MIAALTGSVRPAWFTAICDNEIEAMAAYQNHLAKMTAEQAGA